MFLAYGCFPVYFCVGFLSNQQNYRPKRIKFDAVSGKTNKMEYDFVRPGCIGTTIVFSESCLRYMLYDVLAGIGRCSVTSLRG